MNSKSFYGLILLIFAVLSGVLVYEAREVARLDGVVDSLATQLKAAQSAPVYLCGSRYVAGAKLPFGVEINEGISLQTHGPETFVLRRQATPCVGMGQ